MVGLKDANYFSSRMNRNKDKDNQFKYSSDFSKRYIKKSMNLFLIVALGHELINAIISSSSNNHQKK